MIEEILIEYIKNTLNVPVYGEIPKNRPDKFLIVQEIGEGSKDHINKSTLSIYSYAGSIYEAAVLNESLRAAMEEIANLDSVSSAKIGGGGRNIDVVNKLPRYETIYNITYY